MYSLDIIDDKHYAFINIEANEELVLISAYDEDGKIARSLFYIDKQHLESLIKALSVVKLLLK